jgi:hypothetical protein
MEEIADRIGFLTKEAGSLVWHLENGLKHRERQLRNLLATIFRDCGEHTSNVGLEEAVDEAIKIVAALVQKGDK